MTDEQREKAKQDLEAYRAGRRTDWSFAESAARHLDYALAEIDRLRSLVEAWRPLVCEAFARNPQRPDLRAALELLRKAVRDGTCLNP